MMEYGFVEEIGLKPFVDSLNKKSKEGWMPIWTTYICDTSDEEYNVYKVIIQKKKNYETVPGVG